MSTNDVVFARIQSLITQNGRPLGSDVIIPQEPARFVLSPVSKSKGDDEVLGYDDYDSSGGYHYEYTPSTANSAY